MERQTSPAFSCDRWECKVKIKKKCEKRFILLCKSNEVCATMMDRWMDAAAPNCLLPPVIIPSQPTMYMGKKMSRYAHSNKPQPPRPGQTRVRTKFEKLVLCKLCNHWPTSTSPPYLPINAYNVVTGRRSANVISDLSKTFFFSHCHLIQQQNLNQTSHPRSIYRWESFPISCRKGQPSNFITFRAINQQTAIKVGWSQIFYQITMTLFVAMTTERSCCSPFLFVGPKPKRSNCRPIICHSPTPHLRSECIPRNHLRKLGTLFASFSMETRRSLRTYRPRSPRAPEVIGELYNDLSMSNQHSLSLSFSLTHARSPAKEIRFSIAANNIHRTDGTPRSAQL